MQFTSPLTANVSQIDIGISDDGGIPNAVTISLWTDVGDTRTTQLGSWNFTNLPAFGVATDSPMTISGITGVQLVAGGSYFLFASTSSDTASEAWNFNTVGTTGEVQSSCCGDLNGTLGAFDILSVTPTPLPSTWTMLIAGFLGLGFFAYRGSKKNAAALSAA